MFPQSVLVIHRNSVHCLLTLQKSGKISSVVKLAEVKLYWIQLLCLIEELSCLCMVSSQQVTILSGQTWFKEICQCIKHHRITPLLFVGQNYCIDIQNAWWVRLNLIIRRSWSLEGSASHSHSLTSLLSSLFQSPPDKMTAHFLTAFQFFLVIC